MTRQDGQIRVSCYNMPAMDDFPNSQPRDYNPITQAKHRHEVFWQITFPLLIALTLLLALAVFVILSGDSQVSRWAYVSMIWLILLSFVIAFLVIAILAGLVYGMFRLLRAMPSYTRRAQDTFEIIHLRVRRVSDLAVEPIIQLEITKARVLKLFGK